MPVSANITTSAGVAFTVPAGSFGFVTDNDSDTDIRYRMGATVATSGANKGLLLPAGQSRAFSFKLPLPQDLQVQAIHAGSGSKTVTWDSFTREMAGVAVASDAQSRSSAQEFNVIAYGAKGDAKHVADGVLNSTTTVTSVTGGFTAADVGKEIWGVIAAGTTVLTRRTIATVVDTNTITVSGAAPSNWTGVNLIWGTDDTAAIQAAAAAADAVEPKGVVYVPRGGYIFDDLLFNQSYASGTRTYSVVGDGQNSTVFYPAPDHARTSSAIFNYNANATYCTFRGFSISGYGVEFTGSPNVMQAPGGAEFDDVRIEEVRCAGASLLYIGTSDVRLNKCHFEKASAYGITLAGSAYFQDCYTGNHGESGLYIAGGGRGYWFAGIGDECTAATFSVMTGSYLFTTNALVYAGTGRAACLVDNGTLRATQSEFIPFDANNNVTGLDVNASGIAYLQGCRLVGSGSGYGLDNLGIVYDGGNNTANNKTGGGTIDATLAL